MPYRNRHPLAVLMQAQYAAFGLATVGIAALDHASLARHVIIGAGWGGVMFAAILAGCSALSAVDLIVNHRRGLRCLWLARHRHWCGIGQAFAWLAMVFVGLPRFDALGLMAVYTIAVGFLFAYLLIEARTRRAACALDPAAC